MSKIKFYDVEIRERKRIVGELLEVISSLKNREEMFEFLFRLLTPSEVIMLARRMQIAKMLLENKKYDDICKKMHVSHRTIADIEGWLRENDKRANFVFKKIEALKKKGENSQTSALIDKYSHHRFIKELFS